MGRAGVNDSVSCAVSSRWGGHEIETFTLWKAPRSKHDLPQHMLKQRNDGISRSIRLKIGPLPPFAGHLLPLTFIVTRSICIRRDYFSTGLPWTPIGVSKSF